MGQSIELTASDGHKFSAYRVDPSSAPKGGLVVIQEIFGVNAHIREVCDGFAADGYVAIAPALFDRAERGLELGYEEEDRQKGMALRGQIDWNENIEDAISARKAIPSGNKVGIVGYCFGGTVAWLGACSNSFDAAVGYYGGFIHNFLDRDPTCPVQLHFGAEDQGIPLENVEKIRAVHSQIAIYVYEEAGHGFVCDHRASYQEKAAITSRSRTLSFFEKHLL